jgi:hypothetical protein
MQGPTFAIVQLGETPVSVFSVHSRIFLPTCGHEWLNRLFNANERIDSVNQDRRFRQF